jgi:nucleolar protein 14
VANPFEKKPSSKKYPVLGRVRGEKAQPKSLAKARSDALVKRKETIGVEARQEGRSNAFIDRRFGESEDIPEEDKILMRFQVPSPPWRQPRGRSQVNLPHMPPPGGGI